VLFVFRGEFPGSGTGRPRNSILLIQPLSEVDELAATGAERNVRTRGALEFHAAPRAA
jgi:hypothetical protein